MYDNKHKYSHERSFALQPLTIQLKERHAGLFASLKFCTPDTAHMLRALARVDVKNGQSGKKIGFFSIVPCVLCNLRGEKTFGAARTYNGKT